MHLAMLILSALVVAATQPVGVDLNGGWTLVQSGSSQGEIQADATNPWTKQDHQLHIVVTKTAPPGEGTAGAAGSVVFPVREGEWYDVRFVGQPEGMGVGVVFSLENGDGAVLARTTLPEIGRGRRGRRGGGATTGPAAAPAAAGRYRVSLHARAGDGAAHLVMTPIEPCRMWVGEISIVARGEGP